MRRLDGLSAFMVYSERPKWYQHTLKIAILDSGDQAMPAYETLVEQFAEGIQRVPMLQWKLARVPFGLHHPGWVQAADFDIRYHMRHVSCPEPGDDRSFSKLVAELYAYPMDQSAPLWLCWIVDGLADGKRAIVSLFHHAYTDGGGASLMLERLLQPEEHSNDPVAVLADQHTPGRLRLLVDGLIDLPLLFIREVPSIVRGFRTLKRYEKSCRAAGVEMPPGPADAPYSPFNTALSHRRTFVYKSFALEDVKAISKRLEVTINDLFVSICATAFRRFLPDVGYDPNTGPLVCSLPVNLRPPPEQDDLVGNMTGIGFVWVPVHLEDPMERLRATRDSALTMKAHLTATREANITRVLQILPPLYAKTVNRIFERTGGRISQAGNMSLSNVVGPRDQLKIGDSTVKNWLSIGHVTGGIGLNITVWSYAGNFNVCIMADAEVIPDGWILIDYISEALDEYRDIALAKQNRVA